jgi:hypothetical protein
MQINLIIKIVCNFDQRHPVPKFKFNRTRQIFPKMAFLDDGLGSFHNAPIFDSSLAARQKQQENKASISMRKTLD